MTYFYFSSASPNLMDIIMIYCFFTYNCYYNGYEIGISEKKGAEYEKKQNAEEKETLKEN